MDENSTLSWCRRNRTEISHVRPPLFSDPRLLEIESWGHDVLWNELGDPVHGQRNRIMGVFQEVGRFMSAVSCETTKGG